MGVSVFGFIQPKGFWSQFHKDLLNIEDGMLLNLDFS